MTGELGVEHAMSRVRSRGTASVLRRAVRCVLHALRALPLPSHPLVDPCLPTPPSPSATCPVPAQAARAP